jgi:hypothetical protein
MEAAGPMTRARPSDRQAAHSANQREAAIGLTMVEETGTVAAGTIAPV